MKKNKNKLRNFSLRFCGGRFHPTVAKWINYFLAGLKARSAKKPVREQDPCEFPLIYISEPPRSGGTLLRNLLDGHRECHVFPHELNWEKNGYRWENNLRSKGSFQKIFSLLRDKWTDHFFVNGIDHEYPFVFNRKIQKKVFLAQLSGKNCTTRRILQAYLSSFFYAWIDYQSLYKQGTRFNVAFCPWPLDTEAEDVARFFNIYPDGQRIHVIRDPFGWWASFRNFHLGTGESRKVHEHFERRWLNSARIALDMSRRFEGKYHVFSYDNLVTKPEESMKKLCGAVGMSFEPSVMIPTINTIPKRSNSSYSDGKFGFDTSALERWKKVLPEDEIKEVSEIVGDTYKQLQGVYVNRIEGSHS